MNSLVSDALAKQVRFDKDTMWVDLADGRTLGLLQSVAVSIISPPLFPFIHYFGGCTPWQ